MRAIMILAVIFVFSCKKGDKCYPECVQTVIDNGSTMYSSIKQYSYNNKTVYLFSAAPCCDIYNKLYSEECGYLCAPSGGISGQGDGQCPDFQQNAQFLKVVWEQ